MVVYLSMYGSGEIKNELIAAAWGALCKLTSDLTQYENLKKFVKLVLKSSKGSVQLRSMYNVLDQFDNIFFQILSTNRH